MWLKCVYTEQFWVIIPPQNHTNLYPWYVYIFSKLIVPFRPSGYCLYFTCIRPTQTCVESVDTQIQLKLFTKQNHKLRYN